MATQIVRLRIDPGIQRDGPNLSSTQCIDAQWCRWHRGQPKKMGGYVLLAEGADNLGVARGAFIVDRNGYLSVFIGTDTGIFQVDVSFSGTASSFIDRTPVDFALKPTTWSFDGLYDQTGSGRLLIIAHGTSLNSEDLTQYPIYYGDVSLTDAFVELADELGAADVPAVSGGIVVLQPCVFAYGENGFIASSEPNNPFVWTVGGGSITANQANVSYSKILCGISIRGGAQSPAGLFLTQTSAIRVLYTGETLPWRYDTLSTNVSILSANAAVDIDGQIFWVGQNAFYLYNGVIQEIPCPTHRLWFFENLSPAQSQRVWVTRSILWGEVWIFFPKDSATECSHALIWNYKDNVWYDTELARTAGDSEWTLFHPIMLGTSSTGAPQVYLQDIGKNAIVNNKEYAIPSWFTTSDIGILSGTSSGPVDDVWTRIVKVEPDFRQSGDMTMQVLGKSYPNSPTIASKKFAFGENTTFISPREQRRILQLKFESNTGGGDYWLGRTMLHLERGDSRGHTDAGQTSV